MVGFAMYRPFGIKDQSYIRSEILSRGKRRAGENSPSILFMIRTTQDVADVTSFGYPDQSTFTIHTSRKEGGFYREQTKTTEGIRW